MSQPCPCGSADEYSLCCGRIVSGERVAPDPSHLMRSRYCAFVMKDADYLIKSWHPTCNAAAFRDDMWYYIDGTRPQLGRNDPCPCGSGKKFKKCCGQ
ncbi:SEC-C domain-containing protein [Salmonella enterica]|nr:SEC-C domain-containing protein [Salmonella enterica]